MHRSVRDTAAQVHILEAKNLAARDSGGTSDPIVIVEAFGDKRHTKAKEKMLNCTAAWPFPLTRSHSPVPAYPFPLTEGEDAELYRCMAPRAAGYPARHGNAVTQVCGTSSSTWSSMSSP